MIDLSDLRATSERLSLCGLVVTGAKLAASADEIERLQRIERMAEALALSEAQMRRERDEAQARLAAICDRESEVDGT